jgi:carboxymethylenebutenolidase
MTGGTGQAEVSQFYRHHFISSNPEDITLERISRTVGANSLVDEFILCLTHSKMIDWL